jgi:LAO/AO transport system kinase
MSAPDQLLGGVLRGDLRAVARACRIVDEAWPGHLALLAALFPHTQKAWWVGITGSPGVGKSTLTSRLIAELRGQGKRVGVVAVDPSSPFSGGALLGDRIRMQAHWADPEVFIRSVATRGAVGGLSRTTADVARVLAAWGAAVVLIETVGVGQDELDVMHVAHSTLVVQAPGAGDDLQAAKAGLLECADVFAVNKADLPGAESTIQHLRSMLALGQITASAVGHSAAGHSAAGHSAAGHSAAGHHDAAHVGVTDARAVAASRLAGAAPVLSEIWEVPVVACTAVRGEGVADVLAALDRHRSWLSNTASGQARRLARSRTELLGLLRDTLSAALFESQQTEIEALAARVAAGEVDPYSACAELVARWTKPRQAP